MVAMNAGSAPRRALFTVACILLASLAVWAARHCATGVADGFLVNYRFGGTVIRQKVLPTLEVRAELNRSNGSVKDAMEAHRAVVGEEDLAVEAHSDGREKYIWPLLSDKVGTGNQLVEYMSAAVVAHSLNRTLCLPPFRDGAPKHRGMMWHRGHGLTIEERYSMERLSKFVRVASVDQCLASCNYTLDETWFLKTLRRSPQLHFDENTTDAIWSNGKNMNWSFVSWTTTEDVRKALGASNERCVALGGLFPGLRWRGAYLAGSAYLTASHRLQHSATTIRNRIIGPNTKYLAVHWRFEESVCKAPQLGRCFVRCGDGAITNSGLHPLAKEWIDSSQKQCRYHGVKVTKEDVLGAIYDRALERNLSTVYLATDGWLRGPLGANLVKEVVEMLRERNLSVVGLWRIEGLPNFPWAKGEGFIPKAESTELADLFGVHYPEEEVNDRLITGVEEELCSQAEVFLGSGQSTWSLAIFRSRLARRRVAEILKSLKCELNKEEVEDLDQTVHDQIIQELLSDKHESGLLCEYHEYYHQVPVNATKETFEDEAPDGWLDLEACELRIGHKGGRCEVATCIT